MPDLTLSQANHIIAGAIAHARSTNLLPLLVIVLDARATPKACAAEDGTSIGRFDIAFAKANGALAMGIGSRTIAARARATPAFIQGLTGAIQGGLLPGPGGVLIRDADRNIIGAVGISGDIGDRDEDAAVAGITAAGLTADPGQD